MITAVRPYFRNILNGLTFSEWEDPFNFDNIPSTIIDKAYQMTSGVIAGSTANQLTYRFDYPLTVSIIFKGYNNVIEAVAEAEAQADIILAETQKVANRLNTDGIKDVIPLNISIIPLGVSNDNIVVLQMEFNTVLYNCFS